MMQFKKTLVRLMVFFCHPQPLPVIIGICKKKLLNPLLFIIAFFPLVSFSQTTFLSQGDKQNVLLERLEIKAQNDSVLNFSKTKYFNRNRYVLNGVKSYLQNTNESALSKVDDYNLQRLYLNNTEYLTNEEREQYKSKKPLLKNFYTTPANLYEVHVKDFDLIINPVIQYVVSKESNNDQSLFLNTRGLTVRGKIANKIGFAAYLTDNQERNPKYVQDWVRDRSAVPGNGYYKSFKDPGGLDYFDARGYFTFNVAKYIDVAFGYDKNFIGNGYRSLF